jgi:Zn-dependent peptidase ImmA (M78 family)
VGYLFLAEPPVETVPLPDLRTVRDEGRVRPSPDLLETIYICQQRQEWYRDFARMRGGKSLPFVGSADLRHNPAKAAAKMREALRFDVDERRKMGTWGEAARRFVEQAEELGVLVMVNGVVGSNTHRKLDPDEFRGFALSDPLAPVVFINGADSKSAQMFTLAHELAHLWLGKSALSDVGPASEPSEKIERWCNEVAAELLVPMALLRAEIDDVPLEELVSRLARRFKVSSLVVLRRIHDAGALPKRRFWAAYNAELERIASLGGHRSSGGDFYNTTPVRVSKRFARAIVVSTLEGQTLHRDAFRLLGMSKLATFHALGARLGVA